MCELDRSRGRSEEHGDGGSGLRSSDSHGGHQVCRRLRHSPGQTQGRPGEGRGGGGGGQAGIIVVVIVQITTPKEELMSWQTRPMEVVAK